MMEKPKSSFIKWKKLFQKDINNKNKKTSRHEKITRHDLIMLNAKVEQLEMERTISRRSSQVTGTSSQFTRNSSNDSR
ncbi:hypothetical protein MOUN0_A00430 [Monosporozyma unispora]